MPSLLRVTYLEPRLETDAPVCRSMEGHVHLDFSLEGIPPTHSLPVSPPRGWSFDLPRPSGWSGQRRLQAHATPEGAPATFLPAERGGWNESTTEELESAPLATAAGCSSPVSYTHLTLPTILLV